MDTKKRNTMNTTLSVIKALFYGIPIELDGDKYCLDDDYVLCTTDTNVAGDDVLLYAYMDFQDLVKMCESMSDEEYTRLEYSLSTASGNMFVRTEGVNLKAWSDKEV